MDKIINKLKTGIVEITFKSLKSEREITEKCTLLSSQIPNNFSVKQSNDSDSILCYLVDQKRWEDINRKTIISFK